MTVQLLRRTFTVDEYYAMAEAGILSQDDRVELIEGDILRMTPIGSRHAACVLRLSTFFHQHLAGRALVSVQSPLRLSQYSEPEPDIALLQPQDDFYAEAHPMPADTTLVIKVADSSLTYDQQVKIPLYARHGVPEVWLVDLSRELIELYREPSPQGYEQTIQARHGEEITPQSFVDLTLSVDDILG